MPFDPATLLADISADQPAGENLEFDIEFGALERAATAKPAQELGGVKTPAVEPEWKEVASAALALLGRTHDLRVLVHLATAELHLRGIPGFAETIDVIRQLLDSQWVHLHPQLDPEDDNDPTLRGNALLLLADPARILRPLRDVPLARSPKSGPLTWRDMAIATGALEVPKDTPKLGENVLRGALADTDQGRLAELRAGLSLALSAAASIPASFDREAGPGTGPDLTGLVKLLRDIQRLVDQFGPRQVSAAEEQPADAPAESAGVVAQSGGAPAGGMNAGQLGSITKRADAIRLLDLVLEYYERYEPSSPLPLLVDRARRLADKNFIDILRDLAPDGVTQAQFISGARDE